MNNGNLFSDFPLQMHFTWWYPFSHSIRKSLQSSAIKILRTTSSKDHAHGYVAADKLDCMADKLGCMVYKLDCMADKLGCMVYS